MVKRFITILGLVSVLLGCATTPSRTGLPPIFSLHPVGYPRLVKIVPECEFPKPDNYDSCVVASRMLESATTQISTHRFIEHWEKTAFGETAPGAVEATQRILIPALKLLYQSSQDEYSKTMLKQMDKIQPSSKSSLDVFKRIHHCLIARKKPSECLGQ